MANVVAKLYNDSNTQIAELPDFIDAQIQDALNNENAWTMKYDRGGRNFSQLIQDADLSVKFSVDGSQVFEGVIEEDNWDEVAEDSPVTIAGRSWAGQFEFAKVYPKNGVGTKPAEWSFTTATPGKIFIDLLNAAHSRGTITNLTVDFTATTDSAGQAWATSSNLTIAYKAGVSLLDILKNFGSAGIADWRMNGKTLQMYNPRTFLGSQSGQVLRRGRDITSAPRSRSRRKLGTVYLVAGDEDVNVERTDTSAVSARGRKEQFIAQGGITDSGTLNVVGDLNLSVYSAPRLSKTHNLIFSNDITQMLNSNPDFEIDLSGWNANGATISRESTPGTPPFSGSWSMRIAPDGVSQYPNASTNTFSVKPGLRYDIAAYMMSETDGDRDLNINWYQADGTYVSTSSTSATFTAGQWQEVTDWWTAPSAARLANLSPTVGNLPATTDVLWVDEAVMSYTTKVPKPWRDYKPGQYIDTDLTGTTENYRLISMTVSMGSDGFLAGEVTLNDVFEEREILLDDAITTLTGGSAGSGASTSPTTNNTKDTTVPSVPTGLNGNSSFYLSSGGVQWAQATLNWGSVTTNTDASSIDDFDHYQVHWWYTDQTSIVHTFDTPDNFVNLSSLLPGKNFTFQVRAWDSNGHAGDWSSTYAFDLASDTTPPPVPSTPVVANLLGLLRVTWDGLGSSGENMPIDFKYAEVWYSTVSNFTPGDAGSVLTDFLPAKGSANISGLTYGTTYYVKLVSVDQVFNKSNASAQGSGSPKQVVQTDIGGNVIDFSNIRFKDVGNLIPDGSFELAASASLINAGDATYRVVANPDGATAAPSPNVLKVGPGPSGASLTFNDTINVAPGQKYTLLYSFKQSGFSATPNDRTHIQMVFYDPTGASTVMNQSFTSTTNNTAWSTRNATVFTAPPDAVKLTIKIWSAITTSTAVLYLDQLEVRLQQGTALIEDAAITNAKIGSLAVNDANIANVSAGKLTVGTLTADITVSARIKTANTGARAELNSGGFGLWNSAGTQTVSFAGADGSVAIIGQLKSGPTGKRIEINPTSTNLPEIRFYPDSGSNFGFLNAYSPAGSASAFIGLNSGQVTWNSQTCETRLYMTDTATALEAVRVDTQQRWGPYVSLTESTATMGWNYSDGTDRGFVIADTNFARVGYNNSASLDNWWVFRNDGTMGATGKFYNYVAATSNDALFTGSQGWTSASGLSLSYGPTMISTPAPVITLYYTGAQSLNWWLNSRSTTSFSMTCNVSTTGNAASLNGTMNFWNFRL